MQLHNNDWINSRWLRKDYIASSVVKFNILDAYLEHPPKTILDIGCGIAEQSCLFAEKYNNIHITLIDGNADDNIDEQNRSINFGSATSMRFYHNLHDIEQYIKKRIKHYTLIDCNNININSDIKFDVIYSWASCGFHYPLDTYRELCMKHSHKNTKLIFDIRTEYCTEQSFKIVNILDSQEKKKTVEIKFI
jgi:SAM-dependent methyltransferase